MTARQPTCFTLFNVRGKLFGGALYPTRELAEEALRAFRAAGPSVSDYDSVIEVPDPRVATGPTLPYWTVTERAYGKAIGWRQFLTEAGAQRTAATWRSQSAGEVTVERVEENDHG